MRKQQVAILAQAQLVVIRLLENAAEYGISSPVPRSGESSAVVVKGVREKATSSRQRKHRQPVIQAGTTQAISYTDSKNTGNQLGQAPTVYVKANTGNQ